MRQKAGTPKPSAEKVIKDIPWVTRKQYGAEAISAKLQSLT